MNYFIIGILLIISIILYSACRISSKCHNLEKEKEEYNGTKK